MTSTIDSIASKHLGKKSEGSSFYNPSLLVAVPRLENRLQYKIDSKYLPFKGFDVWHAYEFSCLTDNGVPLTRLLKLRYNCDNEFLVESKSLKLYLNSFNMTKFGKTINECLERAKEVIEKDLSELLHTNVQIAFLDNNAKKTEIYANFTNIAELLDITELKIEYFKETPEALEIELCDKEKSYYLTYDSLRSNCRVTHQPDFGDAFIYYKSKKHIKEDSLFVYLTSFRAENHFHEECCEMIYKRLKDLLDNDDELFVSALYTRRGGIDICPTRWSKNCSFNGADDLLDINVFARNGIKQ